MTSRDFDARQSRGKGYRTIESFEMIDNLLTDYVK
jgi:hypothetical protein